MHFYDILSVYFIVFTAQENFQISTYRIILISFTIVTLNFRLSLTIKYGRQKKARKLCLKLEVAVLQSELDIDTLL